MKRHLLSSVLCGGAFVSVVIADELPSIPFGLDAYRQWSKWPYQRIGMRTYMRSTYDRRGGNEGADASHFLYQLGDDFNVTLDVEGPGVLCFVRTNHWHGSPWHYLVDDNDHVVEETSTRDPTKPVANSVFLPEHLFPSPLAWTWSITKGADLNWVPIAFEKSLRLAYSRTRYGTGYYIYQQFVRGAPLSQPLKAWDGRSAPDGDVLELLNRSGTDLTPQANVERASGSLALPPNGVSQLKTIAVTKPAMLRSLEFSAPRDKAVQFGKAHLRITWDDRAHPSVDAPLALFFGAGTLYNRDNREFLVKAFPVHIRYDTDRVHLACYFPMPFFRQAKIQLVGGETQLDGIEWSLRYHPFDAPPAHVGYFHATYRDHAQPERGKDLVLLDTRDIEGGGDWSGSFIGTSFIFTDRAVLTTLEGDPRFFFDDSKTPQAYGTGTEEWGGGGDYWGGLNMTLPFAGHPVGARTVAEAQNEEDKIHSAYRFLLGDLMPFGKNARIQLEHGGENESTEHYQTVTYWYGAPAASLVRSDTLQITDLVSEEAHHYSSPEASEPYEIISRYEWGPDATKAGAEIYPAHTERARKTAGTSEFTMKLEKKNFGVLLRRTLDYGFPNQRAEVFIADIDDNAQREWKRAGIWSLAGSNTCVYSNPKEELGTTEHHVQTSNRRFRDDEFLLARDLTEGKSAIRIRLKFTPVNRPLFPGQSPGEQAWSEIRYDAYCFILPNWQPN